MDIKSLIGKRIAIHCNTHEKAKEFLSRCDSLGIRWVGNASLINKDNWQHCKEKTCYSLDSGLMQYCDIKWYKSNYYKVISYDLLSKYESESLNIYISQNKKGNKITVTLKTPEGKYIKHATAKCSPEDKFDYDFGKKLALSRLFDLDTESLVPTIKPTQNMPNNKLKLVDINTKESCGNVGDLTVMYDASRERLHIGDIVRVVSSIHKTRLALVCHSNKGYTFLSGFSDERSLIEIYADGTGYEDGIHFFITKEKSYDTLKVGDILDDIEVVE